ncbi:uncharacterized protein EI90DRAFT_2957485 [Cantharellus anzutake]|uniref:uncharacterized protein n=1 Tax=Cantharellus anzutake TaxID=1750568 RepID=UPI001907B784|nr:uncharacterized protein EI90DRAFT_2957485 [Cantharellus anzutake]KAF8310050.1 hypothetical protein EI90DRAFT_2957485 [Cantharellus anzutake]
MPNSKESKRAEKVSSDLSANPSSEEANGAKADDSKGKKSEPTSSLSSVSPNPAERVPPQGIVNAIHSQIEDHPELRDMDANKIQEMLGKLRLKDMLNSRSGLGGKSRKDISEHKFWKTQPVPQPGDAISDDGPIELPKSLEEIKQEPDPLPKDFEWSMLDISDAVQSREVYELLSQNYVEDTEAAFRFQYSAEFLQWALMPPGYHKEWHVGVRVRSSKKLVAFISGVPITLVVRNKEVRMSEINYLCVHKKLRSKRLAPVLIKEVTRQCHLKGIFQAIYTAGVVLPTPVSTCRYFHRSLNIPKLVDTHFTTVPRNMTVARMIARNKLPPSELTSRGLREMQIKDIGQVASLWQKYMERFKLYPRYPIEELRHNILSGAGRGEPVDGRRRGQVVWSYVVEEPRTHQITDFFSFYSLPSTVMRSSKHALLEAAYLYYYASSAAFEGSADRDHLRPRLQQLIGEALIIAQKAGFDVFNALTLMDNALFLEDLKFGPGDGYLNYYLYNYRTLPFEGHRALSSDEGGGVGVGRGIGVVML